MSLVAVKHTTVKMLLGVRPIPAGWYSVGKYPVRTDDTWATGVLVQNHKTGLYGLFSCGSIISVDQRAAKEYAKSIEEDEPNSGTNL